MTNSQSNWNVAIKECVANGERLFEDADLLQGFDRHGTALALVILAEEEFSKAFLLYLVQDKALPWTPEVRRSLRNHECKHLLTVLMEYLAPGIDDLQSRLMDQLKDDPEQRLPREVVSAINLYRYDKIGKWESPYSDVLEPDDYDSSTKRISDGHVDRAKQSAIYVNLGRDGTVLTTPLAVRPEEMEREKERCDRLRDLAREIQSGYILLARDYRLLKEILSAVFSPSVTAVADSDDKEGRAQP